MFCEIFEFNRCCFCFPLRRGILVFGYINIIYLIYFIVDCSIDNEKNHDATVYKAVISDTDYSVYVAVASIDLCFKILLLCAAHLKHIILLKISQYYALIELALFVVLQIQGYTSHYGVFFLMYLPFFVLGFAVNLYFYTLIRSLTIILEKPENQVHYVSGKVKAEGNGDTETAEIV